MELKSLIEGHVLLLRENVNGWASASTGEDTVYPEYPPMDLDKSQYPRGAVDQIGHDPLTNDVEMDVFVGDVLVQITVFTVDASTCVELAGDAHQAIISHHDGTDSNGDPYFPNSSLQSDGGVGEMLEVKTDAGFTRFQKSIDFTFRTTTTS